VTLAGEARLQNSGAVLEWSLVPWDSEIFGFPVAQITRFELEEVADPQHVFDAFEDWCIEHDVRLVSCRLDHMRLRESMAIEERGFRFIETVFGPRFDKFGAIARPMHELQVSEATSVDIPKIEDIAYTVFATGRFLLDDRLAPELSRGRYANWVRSSFGSPSETVLKAEADGDLVGFFIVEHRRDQSVYWHLTAVAPEWQGKGMGLSLWQTMLLRHRAEGATFVETTISGHNLPIMNLYARLGFSFASGQMTFHRLIAPEGRP
jgi:GNAT superfamily N-acetyltransferase